MNIKTRIHIDEELKKLHADHVYHSKKIDSEWKKLNFIKRFPADFDETEKGGIEWGMNYHKELVEFTEIKIDVYLTARDLCNCISAS
tara:strand:- start:4515 stop:4775 length:261 start_codon:yes stop_codon:yes gene_type:complete